MSTALAIQSPAPAPPSRLLLVEDDDTIREITAESLTAEGFLVDAVAHGNAALGHFQDSPKTNAFDLILLDLMMPGVHGLDLCRYLRRRGFTTPILIVSAKDSETDRVVGLEVGADDYLVKPFGMRELVARCRALLRRSGCTSQQPAVEVLKHGELALYPEEYCAAMGGRPLNLPPKQYKLLEFFMRYPRRVWSRDKLLERIWGPDFIGDVKTVDVHIRWLREKLEENPSQPVLITTVRGFGYRFG
ncbi:MAG: alkaline phosphatase [Candidatus Synechococcus spongiarum SP3]|uniref:Alkaline phosphatase n=1 Tax=Candidatus Synechococcus spongiarum SP3 TaxID=1604020 RepID=A0A0G2IVG2_9SYNE|nr:MAG: alkaline phosphatase [Candidatus Synechococcus spongiarum SP3]